MSKAIRPIRIEGNLAYITLTKGYEAVIDAADAAFLGQWNWRAQTQPHTVYVVRTVHLGDKTRTVLLHRQLMGEPHGLEVDHRDSDGLNNRRENLRVATPAQNQHNTRLRADNKSGFKGVMWHKRNRKWIAQIRHNGQPKYLGLFSTPEEAHAAYCAACEKYRGEFGRTA